MIEKIPVFLSSDDDFAPFVAITIVSAMENTKSWVEFYVLDSGITEPSKRKILASAKRYSNCDIEFIRIDENSFSKLPESDIHISKATYNRLLIADLKPELKKVIYSDVDVIFLRDIKELYDESLDDHIIGVVHDAWGVIDRNYNNFHSRLNLPKSHNYFYAGLLLMDLEKWRKENLTKKLIQLGSDQNVKFKLGDQDILNMFFGQNYKLLSVKYEATNGYIINADLFNESIKNDLKKIVIRHFEGAEKPWNSNFFRAKEIPHLKEFWNYATMTPFFSVKHRALASFKKHLVKFLESLYCPIRRW